MSEIKMRGTAYSSGERIVGSISVAAPIFDNHGTILGSVSIGGPATRFTMKKAISCSALITEIANEISLKLGHSKNQE